VVYAFVLRMPWLVLPFPEPLNFVGESVAHHHGSSGGAAIDDGLQVLVHESALLSTVEIVQWAYGTFARRRERRVGVCAVATFGGLENLPDGVARDSESQNAGEMKHVWIVVGAVDS
jgi:hypothetical protein